MADGGFKHLDFLQCCKFAEGDSRILMQKMARDRLKQFSDKNTADFTADEVRAMSICSLLMLGQLG
jgi:hypothetical protein